MATQLGNLHSVPRFRVLGDVHLLRPKALIVICAAEDEEVVTNPLGEENVITIQGTRRLLDLERPTGYYEIFVFPTSEPHDVRCIQRHD